jgi:hypothetical protein
MKNIRYMLLGTVLAVLIAASVYAQEVITDPYEIIDRNLEASGGLKNLKAEKTQYMEGGFALGTFKGTIKIWAMDPDLSRVEVDLGILKATQGDNGEYQWTLDSNNKLQKITKPDQAAVKRREVKRLMADYEYADRESKVFKVSYGGVREVDSKNCYMVIIANNINDDIDTNYINARTFLMEETASIAGENSSDSYFGDYRKVDGLMIPFYIKQVELRTGQAQEITLTKYVSNPDIDPAIFDPPEEGEKDYRFTEGNSAENIPFQFIENHIFVPVIVDCKQRLWVLDTGAAMSVIDKKYADELGVKVEGNMKGLGAGGTLDVSLSKLPPFGLQGIEFKEQAVAVIDMSDLIRLIGVDIAGILGFDFLSRFVTKVDYTNELLSFYDPETFEYKGDGHEVNLHLQSSVFLVEGTLDGEYTGTWLWDLGAGSTSLEGPFAVKHGYTNHKGVESLGHGAANAFPNKSIKAKTFEIAGFTVDNPSITFPYGDVDTTQRSDKLGGLGNTLFRNFVVYCDYANEKVILEKGPDFNKPIPTDNAGLKLTRSKNNDIEVMYVSENTPAGKAGFKIGDIVRSINDIEVNKFKDIIAVRALLTDEPGTQYTFVVDRDGKEQKLKLKLAYLY